MGTVQVTPEYISQAAVACRNTAGEIQEELASLQAYIYGLEDLWQGIASATFQELMGQYQTCATALYNVLTDFGSGLDGNFVNYTDTESANVASIKSVQSALSTTNLS